jgi:hypothetical protein
MNGRVAFPAKSLQIAQRIIASVSVAASSGAASIEMMDGEVVAGSAALTSKAVSFQCLLSIATKVVVVPCLALIDTSLFLRGLFSSSACVLRLLHHRAWGTSCLWPAVIDVVVSAIGAAVSRSDNTRSLLTAKASEVVSVPLSTNSRAARCARLLASAGGLIGGATFLADAFVIAASLCFHAKPIQQEVGNCPAS